MRCEFLLLMDKVEGRRQAARLLGGCQEGASTMEAGRCRDILCMQLQSFYPQQTTNQYLTFFSEVPKLQLLWRKLSRLSCILYDRCLVSTGREARRVAGQTTAPPPIPISLGAQHTYIWPKYQYRRHHVSSVTCPPEEYLLETSLTLQILPSVR